MGDSMLRRMVLALFGSVILSPALASGPAPVFSFSSIDGGSLSTADWRGRPVLVVNTASLCGFARQYDGLEALHRRYGPRGLVVLAVPSDDFSQELSSGAEVKEFCAVNFDLTLPITAISHVKGPEAHPFYVWMRDAHGFTPGWNFNKVLLGPEGQPAAIWGSSVKPESQKVISAIEALLP